MGLEGGCRSREGDGKARSGR